MKTIQKSPGHCHHCEYAAQGQCCERQRTEQVRHLIRAGSVARGGPARMTLNDWRELEREAKEKLQNELTKMI